MNKVVRNYAQDFSMYVVYCEESPTYLVWNSEFRRKGSTLKTAGHKPSGKNPCTVVIQGNKYMVHRIIWSMHNGYIGNEFVIDHIDGNNKNNSVSNLRKVTQDENMRNLKLYSKNTTGTSGVSMHSYNGYTAFFASYYLDGKRTGKSFSIKKYGEDMALYNAVTWRNQQIANLEQQGIFYSDRHGT